MQIVAVSTEKMNKSSYFIQKEQSKEKQVNAVYENVKNSFLWHWLLKVEIVL